MTTEYQLSVDAELAYRMLNCFDSPESYGNFVNNSLAKASDRQKLALLDFMIEALALCPDLKIATFSFEDLIEYPFSMLLSKPVADDISPVYTEACRRYADGCYGKPSSSTG